MSNTDYMEVEGEVLGALPNAMFKVLLDAPLDKEIQQAGRDIATGKKVDYLDIIQIVLDDSKGRYVLKNNDTSSLRPLQSVVSFLNFRIYNPIYLSLGFSLNQNIFTEPLIGLSYYLKVKNVGVVATTGIHFSKEVEIISSSGFSDGQTIDPTIGLTVEDIPTEENYHARFFFGFSFRF